MANREPGSGVSIGSDGVPVMNERIGGALSKSSQHPEDPVQYREGMRRATWNEEVDRYRLPGAVTRLGVIDVRTTGDGARADSDGNLRRGDGGPRLLQREAHGRGDRTGDQNAVGVSRGGHELHAESAKIEDHRSQHRTFGFAPVAASGTHLSKPERSAKEPAGFAIERRGKAEPAIAAGTDRLFRVGLDDEIATSPG